LARVNESEKTTLEAAGVLCAIAEKGPVSTLLIAATRTS
jgi:hypothetical protein